MAAAVAAVSPPPLPLPPLPPSSHPAIAVNDPEHALHSHHMAGKAIPHRAMERIPIDCARVYAIEVRAVKTPEGHVGVGFLVMAQGEEKVLWQESKYVGQGMSWHVAEYGGLLDAMEVMERLGVQSLRARVSSRVVSDQVRCANSPLVSSRIAYGLPIF